MIRPFCRSCLARAAGFRDRLANLVDAPIVILLYHRVTDLATDPQMLAVSPENFRAQMRYIRDHFPVLRLEEDWSRHNVPAVVVTFDDGYADNVIKALPILKEEGVPATFFVSTGPIGCDQEFWWDELERILLRDAFFPSQFSLQDSSGIRSWPTKTFDDRKILYEEMHRLLKWTVPEHRGELMRQLCAWGEISEVGRETHRPMTVAELRALASCELVTIGAHTVTHTALAVLPERDQEWEINASRSQLQAWTGRNITVFSYPFGAYGDFTAESVNICKNSGFLKATANVPGQVHRWADAFRLPRNLVRNWDEKTFSARLRRFFALKR